MYQLKNINQLRQLLNRNGIMSGSWGRGQTKSLDDLWQEIQDGESYIEADPVRRVTTFVQVIIRDNGKVLIETKQEMANGAVRDRNRPLSEKVQSGETIETAAIRGLQQELNISPDQITQLSIHSRPKSAEVQSPSYPGLNTHYIIHVVEADIVGLPQSDFSTNESSPTDPVRKHFWQWVTEYAADID